MKKLVCVVFCLFFLSGLVFGGKFKLELKYEEISQGMKMDSDTTFLLEKIYDWRSELKLKEADIEESITRLYFQGSYSPFSWLIINGITGLGKTELNFNDVIFSRTSRYGDIFKFSWEEKGKAVSAVSEMAFLYGVGVEVSVYHADNANVDITARYLNQQESPSPITLFKESLYGGWEIGHADWHRKLGVEKIKSQEIQIEVEITTKTEKLNLSVGPNLLFAKTNFQMKTFYEYNSVNLYFLELNEHQTQEREFKFQTKNQALLGGFARLGYQATERTEIFVQFSTGAKKALGGGVKINL